MIRKSGYRFSEKMMFGHRYHARAVCMAGGGIMTNPREKRG